MNSFIAELRAEGVEYVAPWRLPPHAAIQAIQVAGDNDDSGIEGAGAAAIDIRGHIEGAAEDLGNTSSDFGSMTLDEVVTLERTSKFYIAAVSR